MGDDESNEPKPGTILARNKEGTLEASAILWRGLCADKPKMLLKYMTKDAVLAEPDRSVYSPKSEPSLSEYLEDGEYEPWTAYKIHGEPEFVEIDMMSSALTYRVTTWRLGKGGDMRATEGMCSSVFRQGPGGDWKCCLHHMAKVK